MSELSSPPNSDRAVLSILWRWIALSALLLLSATWRLWWASTDFPAIPFSQQLCEIPSTVDRWLSVGLVLGLVGSLLTQPRVICLSRTIVILTSCCLVALDQHRLQPWVLQLNVYAAILILCDARRARLLLTAFIVSIYLYSAIGKLDAQFLHTVGQQFWGSLLDFLRLPNPPERHTSIVWIALLPLSELLIGVGLLFRRTRPVAGVAACLFHGTLMLILGPLGLDHSTGVVLWNLQFAVQALVLFVLPAPDKWRSDAVSPWGWGDWVGTGLAIMLMLAPLCERWGYWDHWASWALYAPHSSRTEVWVARTAVADLPASLRREMTEDQGRPQDGALWERVPIERWSLSETGTPIYPQARFQFGVARALALELPSPFTIRIELRSAAHRWDGSRRSVQAIGKADMDRLASHFWLNTLPRQKR